MSGPPRRFRIPERSAERLGSAPFAGAITVVAIGALLGGHFLRSTMGWPGYVAILVGSAALATLALVARHRGLEWHGVLPISLLLFVGWSTLSMLWSQYQWSTLSSVAYQLVVAYLAVFAALTRDLIQIVRAFGDVFRVLLTLSIAVEILSGLLLDMPFTFLGIQGNLAAGGPIQGLAGSRNAMGILALLAVLTFAIEIATRSVTRFRGRVSLVLGVLVLLLTRSPVSLGIVLVVLVLSFTLIGIRRTAPERRPLVQAITLGSAFVMVAVSYLFRARIVELLGAGGDVAVRYGLWRRISYLTSLNPLEGFGWLGTWRNDLPPYFALRTLNGRVPTSALNAFVDVWLQLGIIGLALFAVLLGLALVRAWLVAGTRRNVAHMWSALVLVALALTATTESAVLVEYGWFLLVVCSAKAAQELSWRRGLR